MLALALGPGPNHNHVLIQMGRDLCTSRSFVEQHGGAAKDGVSRGGDLSLPTALESFDFPFANATCAT